MLEKATRREIYTVKETPIEAEAQELFYHMKIRTEDELKLRIAYVFSQICGEYGKQEFFGIVLPAVIKIYGTNLRKAGLRLLEIIDKGAEQKPEQIGKYFKTAVSKKELEYSKKPKEEIVESIIRDINEVILEKKQKYGENYKGIVAVIIHGGFANRNFSLNSDLDTIYISESEEDGLCLPSEERYVLYEEDFKDSLERKIRRPVENFGIFYINDKAKFKRQVHVKLPNVYIVVSPYPEIKTKVESLLKIERKE